MYQLVKVPARLYAVFTSCTAHTNTCLVTGVELWQQEIHHVLVAPDIISIQWHSTLNINTPVKGTFLYKNIFTKDWVSTLMSEEYFYYFGVLPQQWRLLVQICHAENILFCDRQQRGQKVIHTLESSKGNFSIKWTA